MLTDKQKRTTKPTAHVFVKASAGTGKTHVLMARVLRLLVNGTPPEKILCLTYTKAAANEVANRIIETLGKWVMMNHHALSQSIEEKTGETPTPKILDRARGLFAAVLEVPGGFQINTIHSFCQALLKRFPVEASLSPHFTVLDERTASILLNKAIQEVMANPVLKETFAVLSAECNENSFREYIVSLIHLRRSIPLLTGGEQDCSLLIQNLYEALQVNRNDNEEAILKNQFTSPQSFDHKGLQDLVKAALGGSNTEQTKGGVWQEFLTSSIQQRREIYKKYKNTFFKENGEQRKIILNKTTLQNNSMLEEVLAKEIKRLKKIDDALRLHNVARRTAALISVACAVNRLYSEYKRSSGWMDFDDLVLESRNLLSNEDVVDWIRYKLDGGIDHMLIDEAQDTNSAQWKIIDKLTEEFFVGLSSREVLRTFFAVGDSKQSIFRFQGAEPKEFDSARERYEQQAKKVEVEFIVTQLSDSFRSTTEVLESVDTVFRHESTRQGLGQDDVRHITNRASDAGRVEMWSLEKSPEQTADQDGWRMPVEQGFEETAEATLAVRIAKKIEQLLKSTQNDVGPRQPGDIMVLVRQRSDFIEHLVRELKARKIPVSGLDRMELNEQIVIHDLLALASFTLLPDDDYTLACVLKSPFVQINEDDLYKLCHNRQGTLWDALKKQAHSQQLCDAHSLLSTLLQKTDYVTPFDFFSYVLSEKEGRKQLVSRLGIEVNDPIDEFLSLCLTFESKNAPSLQSFLRWFEESKSEIKRDLERGKNEVRILTIHAAKGLQAPVVFLPDTCRTESPKSKIIIESQSLSPQNSSLPIWIGGQKNAVGPLEKAFAEVATQNREESNRLLYVALTRAEDELYIAGWQSGTNNDAPQGSWYAMIRDAFEKYLSVPSQERTICKMNDEDGRPMWIFTNPNKKPRTRKTPVATNERIPLPEWIRTPAPAEKPHLRGLRPSATVEGENPMTSSDLKKALKRGEAIHKLLELLPSVPPQNQKAAAEAFLKKPAFDLASAERERIEKQVSGILSHPQFRPLFSEESRGEVGVAGVVDGHSIAGQVDRLLIREEDIFIADYKTNRSVPKTLAEVPKSYLSQMQLYAALLSKIYPQKKIHAALVWIEDGSLMEIPENLLMPAQA